jgi:hypothetical protein
MTRKMASRCDNRRFEESINYTCTTCTGAYLPNTITEDEALSQQQKLHHKAKGYLAALEEIIDQLKSAGPCPLDGENAIMNIKERLAALSRR